MFLNLSKLFVTRAPKCLSLASFQAQRSHKRRKDKTRDPLPSYHTFSTGAVVTFCSSRSKYFTSMMKTPDITRFPPKAHIATMIEGPEIPSCKEMTMILAPTSPRGHIPKQRAARALIFASSR
eukprot:gnl/TRDRNA2_/TRDRNA2_79261_c0_seq1.p1 gnl/TRDRNA2_/TRDRNA2_79261_c0~~gnl/TRDRNA2_/TRDRNA2_79261_c0_seq1.p1  ORF type:complete len:123 (-),score=6.51 gnl/TRDRNA2_/TRDRNA2_79261_c0_seq1:19-387(-)